MRRIKVEIDLSQYLRLGMSFEVCRNLHLWPPLSTLNEFLRCGVDDVTGATTITWDPFELSGEEYQEAVRIVDPSGSVESFATDDGDWQRWFEIAVGREGARSDE